MPPYVPDHSAAQALTEPAENLVKELVKGNLG